MTTDCLDHLLQYVQADRRVCPNPSEWNELWEMLPNKKCVGQSWEPPPPIILAAWSSPATYKMVRLEEHIRYAEKQGVLEEVDTYLRELKPALWFYLK
jgi:hypothetical protein